MERGNSRGGAAVHGLASPLYKGAVRKDTMCGVLSPLLHVYLTKLDKFNVNLLTAPEIEK